MGKNIFAENVKMLFVRDHMPPWQVCRSISTNFIFDRITGLTGYVFILSNKHVDIQL